MGSRYRAPTRTNLRNERSFTQYLGANMTSTGLMKTSSSLSEGPQYITNIFDYNTIISETVNSKDVLQVVNQVTSRGILSNPALKYFSAYSKSGIAGIGLPGGPGGAGGGGGGGFGEAPAGVVTEQWIRDNLPVEHPDGSGAFLWEREGKASFEFHLPVAPTIGEDTQNHIQLEELPAPFKHPLFMDRINGPVGGDDGNAGAGEDQTLPGAPGAYGMYYTENGGLLTPEAEQYYCSMAWPWTGDVDEFVRAERQDVADKAARIDHSAYARKRLMVYSKKTQKACVCTPGDWGPHPYYSTGAVPFPHGSNPDSILGFYIGLSPDTHQILGTQHGDEVLLGWMPDDAPLGPYMGGGTFGGPPGGGAPPVGGSTPGDPSGSVFLDTIEDMKRAGSIFLGHPNCLMKQSGEFVQLLTEGMPPNASVNKNALIKDMYGNCFLFPSLLNLLYKIMCNGFILSAYSNSIRISNTHSGRPSYHNYGGAIDIFGVGLDATHGNIPPGNPGQSSLRSVYDSMFNLMASWAPETKPNEVACAWEQHYGANAWFRVYKDPETDRGGTNANAHLHIAFDTNQIGRLIPELKGQTPTPAEGPV